MTTIEAVEAIRKLQKDRDDALEALRPFASQADSMWSLNDNERVCGVEVKHYRRAAHLVRTI